MDGDDDTAGHYVRRTRCGQVLQKPCGPAHKKEEMKILQYLLPTKEWGITYGGQDCGLCMEAYTDLDFGACLNTRRSVSGAVLMLAKGAISWHSRMQEVTASGTSEAEYIALSEMVKEAIFLRQVQDFMGPSMRVGCCCCCCFLTLTDPLRIQPWSQDRRNQTKSTGNRR